MKETLNKWITDIKMYTVAFGRWLILGALIGAVCGGIGALFAKSVSYVTHLRAENGWLLLLLPIGGFISVAIYRLLRVTDSGTNQVLASVRTEKTVPAFLAPAVFIGSVITHLFGGSAGREGAALQLGGSIASLFAKVLRLDEKSRHILVMCGMGAFFSAIFGTPLGAGLFALEVACVGSICSAAIFPVFISSITAYMIARSLDIAPERFILTSAQELTIGIFWRVLVIAVAGAIVSMIFCRALHLTEKIFTRYFKNDFLRIAIGGTAIVVMTVILGTTDYNGSGIEVIEHIFSTGEVRCEAFLLKMIFTCITVAAGFKGGEIIPALFIGAGLGGSVAILLGMDTAFGAAVGMAALLCGVTNCPFAAILLCIEMFGSKAAIFFGLSVAISFLLSGRSGLYTDQKMIFSKLNDETV